MKQQEFLEKYIVNCDTKITIADVFEAFILTFDVYEQMSQTVKQIKRKISKEEWNSFINGITMTLFMSLYGSTLTEEEAIKLGQSVEGTMVVADVKQEFDA